MSALIEVQGLTCGYGNRTILKDVSFSIERGEVVAILGGSGCGKSTLLKHLIGLYSPQAGSIRIAGNELVGTIGEGREAILRHLGAMFQAGALFGSMSVLDNVMLPLQSFSQLDAPAIEIIARLKLRLVGLEAFADYAPAELSGGMQKRAAIARAMALEPEILFLDEPSAGLDPLTSAELDALIRRIAETQHVTCVLVSHELASIHAIADRAIMLDRSTQGIIAIDTPQALAQSSDERVNRFFNRGQLRLVPHNCAASEPTLQG
ncbi:ABC transporter ATP-binding protein [Deefgea salmonis]|uniref:ATP-binding cassette domain-containing protein n=1 Tax=Deefgea salmonis TaxID=2875502 RepID=A0ABS8BKU9_9NEIS|nr:ATP-binding cassette domain-containing protein [Deefgea salmonis]MCB5196331.1 ATP-binding cassette domain-containing protein [Deefgea salmonis]